ncbi:transposase [Abyssisolibacter fermentans]|uniref:transposase n=1 Tax=Abyssisolibacter fermentans TaxID=1766203 RepID=UPI000A8A66E0|nr:transposase [Abyssisolibacter fermentans]
MQIYVKYDKIFKGDEMPRKARIKSSTGIYHIMLRGINRKNIFKDDEDRAFFLKTIKVCKEISEFDIYGYCLMGNHVHLLIKENKEKIDHIFKRVGARYVYWYNRKYERIGHLFQDRFKSEPVENDTYLMVVIRYIMQNPIKVGLCSKLEEYKWSSYNDYIQGNGITDTKYIFQILSPKEEEQKAVFIKYINTRNKDKCLEIEEKVNKLIDEKIIKMIRGKFEVEPFEIKNLPIENQMEILKYLKKQEAITLRQIARITGFTVNKVFKA